MPDQDSHSSRVERAPLDQIVIDREARWVSDSTGLEALAASMEIRQLHPITLTHDYRLRAGRRRVAAARLLEWTHIDALVLDEGTSASYADRLAWDEACATEAHSPVDATILWSYYMEEERRAGKERMAAGGRRGGAAGKGQVRMPDPDLTLPGAQARDRAAARFAGPYSGRTYERVAVVLAAARTGDEAARADLDALNAGKLSPARVHKRFQERWRQQAVEVANEIDTALADASRSKGRLDEALVRVSRAQEVASAALAAGIGDPGDRDTAKLDTAHAVATSKAALIYAEQAVGQIESARKAVLDAAASGKVEAGQAAALTVADALCLVEEWARVAEGCAVRAEAAAKPLVEAVASQPMGGDAAEDPAGDRAGNRDADHDWGGTDNDGAQGGDDTDQSAEEVGETGLDAGATDGGDEGADNEGVAEIASSTAGGDGGVEAEMGGVEGAGDTDGDNGSGGTAAAVEGDEQTVTDGDAADGKTDAGSGAGAPTRADVGGPGGAEERAPTSQDTGAAPPTADDVSAVGAGSSTEAGSDVASESGSDVSAVGADSSSEAGSGGAPGAGSGDAPESGSDVASETESYGSSETGSDVASETGSDDASNAGSDGVSGNSFEAGSDPAPEGRASSGGGRQLPERIYPDGHNQGTMDVITALLQMVQAIPGETPPAESPAERRLAELYRELRRLYAGAEGVPERQACAA